MNWGEAHYEKGRQDLNGNREREREEYHGYDVVSAELNDDSRDPSFGENR